MKKKNIAKKITLVLLTAAMLVSAVPAMSVSAATTGSSVSTGVSQSVSVGTSYGQPISGSSGPNNTASVSGTTSVSIGSAYATKSYATSENYKTNTCSFTPFVSVTRNGKRPASYTYQFAIIDQKGKVIQTKWNTASNVGFDAIHYDADDIGVYIYRIKQTKKYSNITLDTHTLTYTVQVSKGTDGHLHITAKCSGSYMFNNVTK